MSYLDPSKFQNKPYLTCKQFAKKHGITVYYVRMLAAAKRFPNAIMTELGWFIPEDEHFESKRCKSLVHPRIRGV